MKIKRNHDKSQKQPNKNQCNILKLEIRNKNKMIKYKFQEV